MTKKEIQKGRRTHARQYDNNKPTDLINYPYTRRSPSPFYFLFDSC